MHDLPLTSDDPRLTAYALGELEGGEREAVEAALRTNPALRGAVEEIRATAAQLQSALAVEELPAVDTPVESEMFRPNRQTRMAEPLRRRTGNNLLRFPQLYFVIGGLAAAGFAVMVALHEDRPRRQFGGSASPVALSSDSDSPESRIVPSAGPAPENSTTANPSPVFIANDLTLMDQARSERDAAVTASVAISATDLAPVATPLSAPLPLLHMNPPGPFRVVLTPPPAYARTPSILPDLGPASPGGANSSAPGEIVVLAAFTVTANRADAGSLTAAAFESAHLPPSPAGAKFSPASGSASEHGFIAADKNRRSSFAIDVGTASYANVRRIIEHGTPPPRDAVRIEEMLNYFPYRYAPPQNAAPFAAALEIAEAPWAPAHRLVRVGLKAREVATADRPRANLVFLLDVSGSMNEPNKLPLMKQSMRLLLGRLRGDDRVAIVTYAGESGLALPSTPVARASQILTALDALTPGGSTNGAMGIRLAYDVAKANFAAGGINRVILCTDGDFNVGASNEGELVRLIEEQADSGVFLTVLGFGMGDYKDATLEKLAHHGHGSYGYIDTRREAERLLVEQVNSNLVMVAKDVRVEVRFNPAKVASYRLIGYEDRFLKREDFNPDKTDAGEVGSGHAVTALYEIVPAASAPTRPGENLLTVTMRYRKPRGGFFNFSRKLEFPLTDTPRAFGAASADFRFAAAVAQYGMILRGSIYRGAATMQDVATWAAAATSDSGDLGGYRTEFLDLVRKTQALIE